MRPSWNFAEMTSPAAATLREAAGKVVVLLPIGALEAHGPHAPLATDTIISVGICRRAAEALAGDAALRVAVLPALGYGVTAYAAGFPGTLGIAPATLEALVTDICTGLRDQGLRHAVIVNSHLEPDHVAVLRRVADTAHVGLLDITRRLLAQRLGDEFRSGAGHAGRYETSLVLAEQPQLVDVERMAALPALPLNMPAEMAAGKGDFHALGMTDAYCGAPAAASAGEGEATFATLTEMLVALIRETAAT